MRLHDRSNSNQAHYRAKPVKRDKKGTILSYQFFNPRKPDNYGLPPLLGDPTKSIKRETGAYRFSRDMVQPFSAEMNQRIDSLLARRKEKQRLKNEAEAAKIQSARDPRLGVSQKRESRSQRSRIRQRSISRDRSRSRSRSRSHSRSSSINDDNE